MSWPWWATFGVVMAWSVLLLRHRRRYGDGPWLVELWHTRWEHRRWRVCRTLDGPGFVVDLGSHSFYVLWVGLGRGGQ